MADITVIVKNNTGDSVFIEDLGTAIAGSSQRVLSVVFDFTELCTSTNLKEYIQDSTFTINDGTTDLNIADAIEYLDCKNAGGGTGASYLNDLLDVDITSPTDKYSLVYNSIDGKWQAELIQEVNSTSETPPDSTSTIWIDPNTDDLYFYNTALGDWVSSSSNIYTFSRSGNIDGSYLGIGGWQAGGYYYIHNKGYITSLHSSALGGESNKAFQIHLDGTPVYSYNLTSYEISVSGLSIQVQKGQKMQIWTSSSGGPISDVICQLFIQWSYSEV